MKWSWSSSVCLWLLLSLAPASRAEHWWEREPIRILDLLNFYDQIDMWTPEETARRKAALGFPVDNMYVHLLKHGFDDQGFYFKTSLAGRERPDFLGPYLPAARKHAMRVTVYFNVHYYTNEFGARHRDWLQVRENGQLLGTEYGSGTDFCVNSAWREWVKQGLRDLCRYPIDGVFFDGPIFRPDTCYCENCRRKFKARYGADLPSKKLRKGRDAQRLLEFQTASLTEFLRDTRAVIKAANPEIGFYMNGGALGGNWATGRMNRQLAQHQDWLASEGGFIYNDLTRTPLWKPGMRARLLETQAGGKPVVVIAGAMQKPWTYTVLPAAELRLLYADSMANGAGIYYSLTPTMFDQPETRALAEINAFFTRNIDCYRRTRSEARVALVWSDSTVNTYEGSAAQLMDMYEVASRREVGNPDSEFWGLAEALLRAHVPFDVVDDWTLERDPLSRYRLIVLGNVASMSDSTAARLREYVRAGGNLLATFETSLYNELGERRANFALADVFGASSTGSVRGPRKWDYMSPTQPHPYLAGLASRFAPSPVYYAGTKPGAARVLARYTRKAIGPYDGESTPGPDAAILLNTFGKGKAAYVSGDLGSTLANYRMTDLYQLVENAARALAPPDVVIEGAPGSLELVVRSQNDGRRLLIHLVNFTGEMTRPIRRVIPFDNLRLKVPAGFHRARTLASPRQLTLRDGAFTLPKVQEYEVVVVEP
jgi:hypothetical protein